jgi:glycosyltransferase involved in cell wall biosynthesis
MNGASEVIVDGENGAVVEEPANIEALAAAIGTFCGLKSRREASAQARKTAETLPMSLNVDKTLQVIRRTLGGS